MTINEILLKAKTDLEKLMADPTEINLTIAEKIIETVKKTCGPKTANSLIKEYKLATIQEAQLN